MAIKTPIYMDYHATTPVDPRVLEEMLPYFTKEFGNAASIDHVYGARALEAVETGRKRIANTINAKPDEIVFTSGATESDNFALQGVIEQNADKGNHIITCVTEHKAILDTCKQFEKKGIKITYLPVNKYGLINLKDVESAITEKTILISIMTANNEIGTIAPISEIGKIAHKNGILFHTDAAQAIGHMQINVSEMNIDLMSISAHKIYGPKGVGALFVRKSTPRVKISPIIYGGGHEHGLRSGTLNVPGIVGFGKSLEIANKAFPTENKKLKNFTNLIYKSLLEEFEIELNGDPINRLAHNLNICINGIDNKALLNILKPDIAISSGSACTSNDVQPSHVLRSIGLPLNKINSSIRIGLGRFTIDEEITYAIDKIKIAIKKLNKLNDSI